MWLDGAGLEILDREECLRLLAEADTGRVALTVQALPAILPVRFVLDGERIVIRTGSGSTLAGATRSAVVAFEADGRDRRGDHDDGPGAEWSVVATGLARHVTDERELAHMESLPLPHWADGGGCLVSISTDRLGGRRTRVGQRH